MTKLTLNSKINKGEYAGKSVSELLKKKKQIFKMIKEGYEFDDEVLLAAHIRKTIKNVHSHCKVDKGEKKVEMKTLPKDTVSVKRILSELNTIDRIKNSVAAVNEIDYYDSNNKIPVDSYLEDDISRPKTKIYY